VGMGMRGSPGDGVVLCGGSGEVEKWN
jgi:hypothetical protein